MIEARRFFGFLAALWLAGGVPVAAMQASDDNMEARAGDLRIIQLWTANPDAFLSAWRQPTPPRLTFDSRIVRNQPVQQVILFSNCTPDGAGRCRLTARVVITAPDGTPYVAPMEFEALPATTAGPRNTFALAPNAVGFRVEDGEQLGRYRIALSVTDVNASVTAHSVVHIDVREAAP